MKKPLNVPKFKNEDEEFEFWSNLDLSEYFEPKDAVSVSFPNLKPTSQSISLRIPVMLLNKIKEQANAVGVPYQSYIKTQLHSTFMGV
jgi:predicted DNA binding CopG/RHH family protein